MDIATDKIEVDLKEWYFEVLHKMEKWEKLDI